MSTLTTTRTQFSKAYELIPSRRKPKFSFLLSFFPSFLFPVFVLCSFPPISLSFCSLENRINDQRFLQRIWRPFHLQEMSVPSFFKKNSFLNQLLCNRTAFLSFFFFKFWWYPLSFLFLFLSFSFFFFFLFSIQNEFWGTTKRCIGFYLFVGWLNF